MLLRSVCLALLLLSADAGYGEDLLYTYQLAVQNDPVLQQADAQHKAQLESKPQSLAQLLPDFSISAHTTENSQQFKYTNSRFFGSQPISIGYNSHGYSATLTQPIYHQDYFVQYSQAGVKVRQADSSYLAAQQDLIVRVSQAYFNVLSARASLELAQAQKSSDEKQLEQTQQRFKVGLIAITDVHQAQAAYDLTVAQEIQATNQVANAREALRQITGRYLQHLADLGQNVPLAIPAPEDIDQWTQIALAKNPTLDASRNASEVARQQVNIQRAGHYPTLDMVLNTSDAVSGGVFGSSDIHSTSVSLQLNVPLFEGGMVASRTRQAHDEFIQAQQALVQQRRATINQIRQAYLGVQSNISLVKAYKQAIVSNTSSLEATKAGLEVGTQTTLDVLQARSNLFSARLNYAQARYNYIVTILQLKQSAGTLTEADLVRINKWLQ
ncbi:MAG TPA: TolC family outer membrane protein [Gammaproteobacteria bacterium]|nr:TolC family outer membrane protein [Gammaproteobacteria bacterium]